MLATRLLSRKVQALRRLPLHRAISVSAPAFGPALEEAAQRVKTLSQDPGNAKKLELYALFKQATVGANTSEQPSMFNMVARYKWDAWSKLGGMSQDDAEQAYIALVDELVAADSASGAGAGSAADAVTGAADSGVNVEVSDAGVMRITMSRPSKKNAISWQGYEAVTAALGAATTDPAVKVVVLTGDPASGWYSSGNDLSTFTENMPAGGPEQLASEAAELLREFVEAFIDCGKPVVAGVNGPAIGIAVTTLGLVDYVIASHAATFATPFTKLGQSPEACSSFTFPRMMGPSLASDVLLFGRKLSAEEAERANLVGEVVEAGSFAAAVEAKAAAIAALPPRSMALSKQMMRQHEADHLKKVNRDEIALLSKRWLSDECMAAIAEFMTRKADK